MIAYLTFCVLLGIATSTAGVETGSLAWWFIVLAAFGLAVFSPFK